MVWSCDGSYNKWINKAYYCCGFSLDYCFGLSLGLLLMITTRIITMDRWCTGGSFLPGSVRGAIAALIDIHSSRPATRYYYMPTCCCSGHIRSFGHAYMRDQRMEIQMVSSLSTSSWWKYIWLFIYFNRKCPVSVHPSVHPSLHSGGSVLW